MEFVHAFGNPHWLFHRLISRCRGTLYRNEVTPANFPHFKWVCAVTLLFDIEMEGLTFSCMKEETEEREDPKLRLGIIADEIKHLSLSFRIIEVACVE